MSYFNINEPCSERWESMSLSEKGRFCASCKKTVRDLAALSSEEIINELKSSNGETCGRVSGMQLRDAYAQHHLSRESSRFVRNFFLAILLSFGAALFSVKDASAESSLRSFIKEIKAMLPDSTAGYKTIKGIVTDKDTREPLPFANVRIYSGDSLIAEALSNMDGEYSIKIKKGMWKEIDVKASYIGYEMEIRKVELSNVDNFTVEMPIRVGQVMIGAVIEVVEGEMHDDPYKLDGMKRTYTREELRRIPR